jgi:glycosyltransferase involved in cell wall biosynthesis
MHVATIPMTLEILMDGQIRFMKERGFEVIAVSSPGDGLSRLAARDGVKVYAVPMARGIAPIADLKALFRLWRLMIRLRPDIVHASTGKAGPLATLAATLARVPVKIYLLRGLMMDRRDGLAKRLLASIEWATCRAADRVLAVSRSVADVVIRQGLCPAEKIAVPGKGGSNGVDAEGRFNRDRLDPRARAAFRGQYDIPLDAVVICYVGRVVAGKGVAELAAAWQTIRELRRDAFLVIAGPSEAQDPVPEHALGLLENDKRVVMTGYVPHELLPNLYAAADIVVLPSYSEGLPNVPLEAGAMELPVVATSVTGCVDAVVHGATGTLVPVKDPVELARAIGTYIDSPELRSMHGKAGRDRALMDFRPAPIWEAVYEEYERLLRNSGRCLPAERRT